MSNRWLLKSLNFRVLSKVEVEEEEANDDEEDRPDILKKDCRDDTPAFKDEKESEENEEDSRNEVVVHNRYREAGI